MNSGLLVRTEDVVPELAVRTEQQHSHAHRLDQPVWPALTPAILEAAIADPPLVRW